MNEKQTCASLGKDGEGKEENPIRRRKRTTFKILAVSEVKAMAEEDIRTFLMGRLSFDEASGLFRWKTHPRSNKVGTIAGHKKTDGYTGICVNRIFFKAHRIAWLFVHGKWPSKWLDHINGIRSDNRIENLREATPSENGQNIKGPSRYNTSGYLGVFLHCGKWCSKIVLQGKIKWLGTFKTKEDAYAAYLNAKRQHHPFSTL